MLLESPIHVDSNKAFAFKIGPCIGSSGIADGIQPQDHEILPSLTREHHNESFIICLIQG